MMRKARSKVDKEELKQLTNQKGYVGEKCRNKIEGKSRQKKTKVKSE